MNLNQFDQLGRLQGLGSLAGQQQAGLAQQGFGLSGLSALLGGFRTGYYPEPSTKEKMQYEVDQWLKDWDK
jgi:hypothetical protein